MNKEAWVSVSLPRDVATKVAALPCSAGRFYRLAVSELMRDGPSAEDAAMAGPFEANTTFMMEADAKAALVALAADSGMSISALIRVAVARALDKPRPEGFWTREEAQGNPAADTPKKAVDRGRSVRDATAPKPKPKPKPKPPKVSPKIAAYIAALTVPSGALAGEAMEVWPWQRRVLERFDKPGDIALSVARGNGKTGLCGAIAAAHLSPSTGLAVPGSDIIIVASAHGQARIAFADVLAFMRQTEPLDDKRLWRVNDSAQRSEIRHVETGARVVAIGSDPRRAHGLRPFLILADEPAQWEPGKADAMVAALRTAQGKSDCRIVWLGTAPQSAAGHFFETELEQPGAIVYRAGPDDPLYDSRTWQKANPSLQYMPTLRHAIREEARRAKTDEAIEASFKALRLNLGGSGVAERMLCSGETWKRVEARLASREDAPVVAVDLASTRMAASAAVWPSGQCDAFGAFPSEPGLDVRGQRDNVGGLYSRMAARGELIDAGQTAIDIPALLREILARWGAPLALVCDRWRDAELRQAANDAAFPRCSVIVRGMGYRDGSEDIRNFQRAIADDWLCADESLLIRHALSVARLVVDPAGNEKFARHGPKTRDDAAVALVLAASEAYRRGEDTTSGFRYRVA